MAHNKYTVHALTPVPGRGPLWHTTSTLYMHSPRYPLGANLSFFGLGPWAIIHGLTKCLYLSNTNSFERSFSKLSENHDIGSAEFKLWKLKEPLIIKRTYHNWRRGHQSIVSTTQVIMYHYFIALTFPRDISTS